MALPIKHDLKPSALAMIRGRMWNAVARICSYWTGGKYIIVRKPEHPSSQNPISWDLDTKSAAPDIAKEFDQQNLWRDGVNKNDGNPTELAKSVAFTSTDSENDKEWNKGDVELDEDDKPLVTENGTEIPVGATLQIVSRIVSVGGVALQFYLRNMEIDSTGKIKSISKEKGYFEVVLL